MTPKVAICIPSGDRWHAEMALSCISLVRETALDIAVLNLMGSQITFQRNMLVKRAIGDFQADYLFWWDSDMIFPASTLYELLGHKKDIVGAVYLKRSPPYPMIGKVEYGEGRLKPAVRMPGGCMLVKADVYKKLDWPWYYEVPHPEIQETQGEDYSFCEKARENGYEIWCDINLSQRIVHIGAQHIQMQLREGHPDRVEITNEP